MKNYKKLMALAVGLLSVGYANSAMAQAAPPIVPLGTLDVVPGQPFIFQIGNTGGAAAAYAIAVNSPYINASVDAETGLISGTITSDAPVTDPVTTGIIAMSAFNDDGGDTKNLTLSFKAAAKPQILSPQPDDEFDVVRGTPVSIQVEASNSPASYTLEDTGATEFLKVPAGLTISGSGLISGVIPSTVAFGTYDVRVFATNTTGESDKVAFSINVGASPTAFQGTVRSSSSAAVSIAGTAFTESAPKKGSSAVLVRSRVNNKVILDALATADYWGNGAAAVIPASKGYKIVAAVKPSDTSVIEYFAEAPDKSRTLIPDAYLELDDTTGPEDGKNAYVNIDGEVLKGVTTAQNRSAIKFSGTGLFKESKGGGAAAGRARVSGVNDGL